jgi:hypothetical protein
MEHFVIFDIDQFNIKAYFIYLYKIIVIRSIYRVFIITLIYNK